MANVIKPKRTTVAGRIPTTANIAVGEIALNMADSILYFRDTSDNIKSVSSGLATVGTAGTYTKVTTDAFGRVTAGTTLSSSDVPTLNQNTTGSAGSVTNSLTIKADSGTTEGTDLYTFNGSSAESLNFVAGTNVSIAKTAGTLTFSANDPSVAWSEITSKPTTLAGYGITDGQPLDADLTAIAGLTGTTGLLKKTALNTWSLDTNTYLTGNQSISVSGDATGSGTTSISLTLANSGVTAGTYNNSATAVTPLTVDAKGRVTATGTAVTVTPAFSSITSKPTTLSGYGITDAATSTHNHTGIYQPLDNDLTAIAGLTGTTGLLKKTATDTWALDTTAYTTNTGTVTSVSATAGTGITISGSPITTSGTLTITNSAPNVTTDITITHNASTVVVNSSDGADGTVNAATTSLAGVMSSADKTKLDGIATGATSNTGTVTSIATSGAITGGTITTTGTISHSTADGYLHIPATGTTNNGKVLTAGATAGSVSWVTPTTGTVTSVAMSTPTGLTVTGSPITSSGTLALTLTSGYSIPTTTSQTNWDTAYTDRNKWDGGATGLTASTGRTSLGSTTVGSNMFTLTNPSAITFPRFNADNTVSALDASTFRTAIGAGTGNGTVTGVTGTAPIVSSGGTAPAISITQATTSTNGYLSSTDWNTFNSKTSNTGTVTSVIGGSYLTGGIITTSGTLAVDATTASTASKIVARDSSGDINARLFRSEYDTTNATIGFIMTQVDTASNNYIRPSTPAQLASALSGSTMNINGSSTSCTGNSATVTNGLYTTSKLLVAPNTSASNPDTVASTGIDYCNSISLFGQTDGALYTNSYSTSWQHQIFGDYRSGNLAVRGKNNGTWTGWNTVWTSGNDGAGSGLDADLLDGMQPTNANTASTIVQRDSSGNFSAGTITATLSGNATTATTATKLGSSTVGGTAKGIYLSSGTATEMSSTVGSTTQPVYMNAGTITAITGSIANSTTGSSASCTGNSATATKLATAITINGVSFDGSANITVPEYTTITEW